MSLPPTDGYRQLYASGAEPNAWIALVGLIFGGLIVLFVMPLDGFWITVLLVAAIAIGVFAFAIGRRRVTHLSRFGDTLSVSLVGNRSFSAPVSDFTGWRYVELGRASALNFFWRGQRYAMSANAATLIDAEGFADLDADLGRALAGRWNADALRPKR